MKFVYAIEGLSLWVGRAFGWCIMILTLSVVYEVFVRYVLNSPTVWAFDMMIQMYFVLYFLFFFPGILALVWYGYEIASDSWRWKEVSFNSPASIQIYFFKSLIPLSGSLLVIQGIAELVRCVMAMRSGVWPERLADVKETEDLLAAADLDEISAIIPGRN
jgi:TRAP-type mannitol/chloroaromatic compound transport system permease small subunit